MAERVIGNSERVRGFYYPGFALPSGNHTGLEWQGDIDYRAAQLERRVPIIKLHGSVNWFKFQDNLHRAFYDQDLQNGNKMHNRLPFNKPGLPFRDWIQHLKESCGRRDDPPESVTPAIIPPMLGKTSDIEVFAHQWKKAVQAIRQAREVWIIGYSFPITDAFMTRLLAEGVKDNGVLEVLCIANPDKTEQFVARLKTIFNATFVHDRVRLLHHPAINLFRGLGGSDNYRAGRESLGDLPRIA